MAKKKLSPFPPNLFVVIEEDGDDHYFVSYDDLDHIEDGQRVAIYSYDSQHKVAVTKELVEL